MNGVSTPAPQDPGLPPGDEEKSRDYPLLASTTAPTGNQLPRTIPTITTVPKAIRGPRGIWTHCGFHPSSDAVSIDLRNKTNIDYMPVISHSMGTRVLSYAIAKAKDVVADIFNLVIKGLEPESVSSSPEPPARFAIRDEFRQRAGR